MTRLRTRILLAGGAAVAALAVGETVARVLEPQPLPNEHLHVALPDSPYLYGLDQSHPEVSSQALRDRDFVIPKPDGTRRVLLLGDSVVYGVGVARDETLSRQLEPLLDKTEVVNAGVHGYSAYNELQWYLDQGRAFEADVVVVVFCLNDVVDPFLHWCYAPGIGPTIPDAAIPNPTYHREHTQAQFERQRRERERQARFPVRELRRSALFRLAYGAVTAPPPPVLTRETADGRTWPIRLTGEDAISIEVLMNPESAEWRWLRNLYRELRDAVAADGAELVVASAPLSYQLDPDYPFVPQSLLAAFCKDLGVRYVETLSTLRKQPDPTAAFLGEIRGHEDIWHLSPLGLGIVARCIADAIGPLVEPR